MNRRGFLTSCIAMAAAPAIVRADSLMRIVPRETVVYGLDPVTKVFTFPAISASLENPTALRPLKWFLANGSIIHWDDSIGGELLISTDFYKA